MSMTNHAATPKVAIEDELEAEILTLMLSGSIGTADDVLRLIAEATGASTEVHAALERLSLC